MRDQTGVGGAGAAGDASGLQDKLVVRARAAVGDYSVARVCPSCGLADAKRVRPERFLALGSDRVCRGCGTRYIPPTRAWGAVVFILIGFLLAGACGLSIVLRLRSGNPLGIPAMAVEGFLGVVGLLAVRHGTRALLRPGTV